MRGSQARGIIDPPENLMISGGRSDTQHKLFRLVRLQGIDEELGTPFAAGALTAPLD